MTKEELKQHCERQVEDCEKWAKLRGNAPSERIYEEHKLILELIKALEQQPCDDCVSRAEVNKLYDEYRPRLATHVSEFGDKLKALSPVAPAHKIGKWIKQYTAFVNDDNQIVTECHCTNCYGISYFRSIGEKLVGAKYCPNCGAEMRGNSDGSN